MIDDIPTEPALLNGRHDAPLVAVLSAPPAALRRRIVESLYTEAMLLADEVRTYFERGGHDERLALDPMARIGFSCESLKTTTRLMHVIAWLLTQRAIDAGELAVADATNHDRLLGDAVPSDGAICARLPDTARLLIAASEQLYKRTLRLQGHLLDGRPMQDSPVHGMLRQLEDRF